MESRKGFTLIQMAIALGISSIIISAIMTSIVHQQKEVMRLSHKMALMDIGVQVRRALSRPGVCSASLNNVARTWNVSYVPTDFSPSNGPIPTSVALAALLADDPTSGMPPVVQIGNLVGLPGTSVTHINLEKWRRQAGDPNEFVADIVIKFDSKLGPIAPEKILGLNITTDPSSPENAKVVSGCSISSAGSGSGGGGSSLSFVSQTCQDIRGPGANRATCVAACPAGLKAIGGGCSSVGSSEERLYVRVNSVAAGGTGWECAVTEDYALPSAAQSVANGHVTCALDSSPFEFQTCQEVRGAGANRASCTASCSSGKRVVSGGCSSTGSSEERTYVRINSPTASGNGWECSVTEEYTLPSAAQTIANGFAVCH